MVRMTFFERLRLTIKVIKAIILKEDKDDDNRKI
jgi:hypothetical protein